MVDPANDPQLIRAFYRAALFLKAKVEHEGWMWVSNYLREHVRAATGLRFTNSVSPKILRRITQLHPELAPYIKLKPLKATAPVYREEPAPRKSSDNERDEKKH